MNWSRLLKHLRHPAWHYRRLFDGGTLWDIETAIKASESRHRGELRFVAEGALSFRHLFAGVTARDRATEVFSQLRIWDTADNSGILVYVQLADRRVEILADRGIAEKVPQHEWDAICRRMETLFSTGQWRQGALAAIEGASELLARHFPASGDNPNELPDAPVIM